LSGGDGGKGLEAPFTEAFIKATPCAQQDLPAGRDASEKPIDNLMRKGCCKEHRMMSSRERIKALIGGRPADRCGLWLGNPEKEMWPLLHRFFQTKTEIEFRQKLHDDFCWIVAPGNPDMSNRIGLLADAKDERTALAFDLPDPDDLDFSRCFDELSRAGNVYRASGLITTFHHNAMDLFGMENYLVKMYECPNVVHAVINRICSYYYEANLRFFKEAGDRIDGFWLDNDFGTQLSMIFSPAHFDEFILPWYRRFADLAHSFGYQVITHSCGAVHELIDRLITAGIDCLHPLQPQARAMDAETLARDFGGRISFLGGIDIQRLLILGTPEEVRSEVRRIKSLLGPRLIVSPSHEGYLPDVNPANIQAMVDAAIEE
jgi:uroporphyrinogen decarboxylase